jgi:hypothetical protein
VLVKAVSLQVRVLHHISGLASIRDSHCATSTGQSLSELIPSSELIFNTSAADSTYILIIDSVSDLVLCYDMEGGVLSVGTTSATGRLETGSAQIFQRITFTEILPLCQFKHQWGDKKRRVGRISTLIAPLYYKAFLMLTHFRRSSLFRTILRTKKDQRCRKSFS